MKRDFESWFSKMKESIATWDFYTDFNKVYNNIENIKIELNLLNSLIGSKNIEQDFIKLVTKYSEVLKAIPIFSTQFKFDIASISFV